MNGDEWTVIRIRKRTKVRMAAIKGKNVSYDTYLAELHSRIVRRRNGKRETDLQRLKLWP